MRQESERHKSEMNESRLNAISLQRALAEREQELESTCRLVKDLQGQLAQHQSSQGDLTKAILQNQVERSEDRTRIESLEQQLGTCKRDLAARAQEVADLKFKAQVRHPLSSCHTSPTISGLSRGLCCVLRGLWMCMSHTEDTCESE